MTIYRAVLEGVAALLIGEAAATAADVVVAVTPGGPVRIRCDVTLRGKPVEDAWAATVAKLFAAADRNGDGTLDAAERATFAPPRRMAMAAEVPLRLAFDGDAPVTREAFAAAVRAAGFGPVSASSVAGRADSAALTAALVKHLDRDGDGRLSPDELRAARERLATLDVNEDEYIAADELLGRPAVGRGQAINLGMNAEPAGEESRDLIVLPADPAAAAKRYLAVRGGSRATALRPSEFGASGPAFATWDADKNGRLDATELAAWLASPADADFAVGFAPAVGGDTTLTLGGTRYRIDPPASADADACRVVFQFVDAGGLFELLDANGDGKLSPRELLTAADAVRPYVNADGLFKPADLPRRVTVRPTATTIPAKPIPPAPTSARPAVPAWFAAMDRNGDGDVSLREFVGPLERFRQLDRDGDGLISAAEANAVGGK